MSRLIVVASLIFFCNSLVAQKQFKAFLFTKTAGWHHESINAGVDALKELAQRNHFELIWDENAERRFNEEFFNSLDVVIFLNTTEDVLTDEQQEVLKRFIQSGKGFVGIHAASDTEYEWPWYNRLVGRMFHIHPAVQTAMLEVEDSNFPGMEVFPDRFMWTDEWYEFKKEEYSKDIKVLLTIDESTYEPYAKWGEKVGEGMGYHPISWYQYYDGGRSFYTALGHLPEVYQDQWFIHHIYGGIYWAATGKGISE